MKEENNYSYTEMEDRFVRLMRYSENLVLLSKGLADVYPDAEGAMLIIEGKRNDAISDIFG